MRSVYECWKQGELDEYIDMGIIKTVVPEYCKIYEVYLQERKKGLTYTKAVQSTAEITSKTEITVRRAVAFLV